MLMAPLSWATTSRAADPLFSSRAAADAAEAATLPAGFDDALVTRVGGATALAFTPDGRMLITTKNGQLRVYQNGSLLSTSALDLTPKVCAERERGLLGVAVDPDFATTHAIFLYYTFNKYGTCAAASPPSGPVNRVSRFILGNDNRVDPASESVLVDEIPSTGAYHAAGGVYFGKDGYLYVSVGDGGCDYLGDSGCAGSNDAARDRNALLGKVLRISSTGTIPADNPFRGTGTARCNLLGRTNPGTVCQETFAWGLRNPFRLAFDPNASGTRFFINDVGQETWEEIDDARAGADYGWNVREGPCATNTTTNCGSPPAGMTNPIYDYPHSSGCSAVTGGAFVPRGLWPATYDGTYLFGDYVCGKLMLLRNSGSGWTASDFATGIGAIIEAHFGPWGSSQALYYIAWNSAGPTNDIRRISYGGNRTPVAVAAASPTSGRLPLNVTFAGGFSSDPDGGALTYDWDFGDGSAHSAAANPTHTYTTAGTYLVTLRVTDPGGATATDWLCIDAGNPPPAPSIQSPTTSTRFKVGQTITLHGGALDGEDGALPSSALSWTVILHHNTHTHPFLGPATGNDVTFTAPPPEDLRAAATSYLEVRLTATDAKGLSRSISQDLRPNSVPLTFQSDPSGLRLEVDGSPITAPQTFTSWEGYVFTAKAEPALQGLSGKAWAYASWSDGGARQHTITTPANPTTYTAHYSEARYGGGVWIGGLLTMALGGLGRLRSRRARARAERRRAGPAGAGPPPPSAGSRPR
jgi:glucose/arabinose dehydrogenase/PKD repeat protein